ncbi:MAG: hypothetical protein DMD67_03495 [Gemmatimonadetes bacterium]|nr:MAG: hypothetical protein DMD67_03495 [Gemmatimonadota bacterium]
MCGIAGRFHPLTLPAAPGWSTRASALLAHRGPDGEGHWRDARCELVHRRLALIDLSPTGRQPMANEDGSVQVIFNGEIYNYPPPTPRYWSTCTRSAARSWCPGYAGFSPSRSTTGGPAGSCWRATGSA